jgi:FkbM family methyltransferase
MKLAIFDIGSNDGLDGIVLALLNPSSIVYSFEPNSELNKKINYNKKIIEKFFGVKIKNYRLYNLAISNSNKFQKFYINKHDLLSSLKRVNINFTNKDDLEIKDIKKIKVIRLDKFCKAKKIDYIQFIHSDTQGSDLEVLEGLGVYKKKLIAGVIETTVNHKNNRYLKSTSLKNVKKKFKTWNFYITKINPNFTNIEYDVYFKYKNYDKTISYAKTNYNPRFFRRILINKIKIKDYLALFFLKFIYRY